MAIVKTTVVSGNRSRLVDHLRSAAEAIECGEDHYSCSTVSRTGAAADLVFEVDPAVSDRHSRLIVWEDEVADATELICQLMQDKGVNQQDLARRLGKSQSAVSQLLTGERNMTLRTLADVLFALGHEAELTTQAVRP